MNTSTACPVEISNFFVARGYSWTGNSVNDS